MAPKTDKAKSEKSKREKSDQAAKLAAYRKEHIVFAPKLGVRELWNKYYLFWAKETPAHPRTRVYPAVAKDHYPGGYYFFAAFFHCGLCPPFSNFFCDIMNTYGLHLLDFTPNAILTMSVFAHMCENFVGIQPNVALFRHFFIPRVEADAPLSGGISWVFRLNKKSAYLPGELRGKWEEWRAEWCWVVEERPQHFTAPRTSPIVRGRDWSNFDSDDSKLDIALVRILRLRMAPLSVAEVGADFLRRRIAPLQDRKRPAWQYGGPADIMRLRPGLNFNFTTLELRGMVRELFKFDPEIGRAHV